MLTALGLGAFFAGAVDDQAVSCGAEAVLTSRGLENGEQLGAGELEQPVALGTVEVVVGGVAVVVLIDGPAVENELAEQAGVDELGERAIDRRPADVPRLAARRELLHELVGIEMLMAAKDVVDQGQPLLGHSHAAALQVLDEPIPRRKRDGHTFERSIRRHQTTKTDKRTIAEESRQRPGCYSGR